MRAKVGRAHFYVTSNFDGPWTFISDAAIYLSIWRLVFGALVSSPLGNPFMQLYLGWWMVEVYLDLEEAEVPA